MKCEDKTKTVKTANTVASGLEINYRTFLPSVSRQHTFK